MGFFSMGNMALKMWNLTHFCELYLWINQLPPTVRKRLADEMSKREKTWVQTLHSLLHGKHLVDLVEGCCECKRHTASFGTVFVLKKILSKITCLH